jgi:hypothetical protein
MLPQTHRAAAPWTIVHADDKNLAQVNLSKGMLSRPRYEPKDKKLICVDRSLAVPLNKQQLRERAFAT